MEETMTKIKKVKNLRLYMVGFVGGSVFWSMKSDGRDEGIFAMDLKTAKKMLKNPKYDNNLKIFKLTRYKI